MGPSDTQGQNEIWAAAGAYTMIINDIFKNDALALAKELLR